MQAEIKVIRDRYFPSKNTEEENKKLCERFPFLAWYGDPLYMGYSEEGEPDYGFTWEDELESGWRKAMCPQIWEDLKAILEKADYVDKFRFTQIKEKFGELRMYYCGVPEEIADEIDAWEDKYVKLSNEVCIRCGEKKAEYMTLGWITFVCKDCAKAGNNVCIKLSDAEAYYNTPREQREKFYVRFEEKTSD